MTDHLQRYAGMQIIIEDDFVEVKRSICDRLFSWPWRPLQKKQWVPNVACPPDDEFWKVGRSTLICNVRSAAALKSTEESK